MCLAALGLGFCIIGGLTVGPATFISIATEAFEEYPAVRAVAILFAITLIVLIVLANTYWIEYIQPISNQLIQ